MFLSSFLWLLVTSKKPGDDSLIFSPINSKQLSVITANVNKKSTLKITEFLYTFILVILLFLIVLPISSHLKHNRQQNGSIEINYTKDNSDLWFNLTRI